MTCNPVPEQGTGEDFKDYLLRTANVRCCMNCGTPLLGRRCRHGCGIFYVEAGTVGDWVWEPSVRGECVACAQDEGRYPLRKAAVGEVTARWRQNLSSA